MAQAFLMGRGGSGLPKDWVNRVTYPALESVAKNAAVKIALSTDLTTNVTKLANPATLPAGPYGYPVISANGLVMIVVIGSSSGMGSVTIMHYSRASTSVAWSYVGTLAYSWGTASVNGIDITPDGKFLLFTGGFGAYLHGFNGSTYVSIEQKASGGTYRGSFSPDGRALVLWQGASPYLVSVLKLNSAGDNYAAFTSFSPGSSGSAVGSRIVITADCKFIFLYGGSYTCNVHAWNGTAYGAARTITTGVSFTGLSFDVSPSGRLVAIGGSAGIHILHDSGLFATKLTVTANPSTSYVYACRFTPDEKYLIIVYSDSPYFRIFAISSDGTVSQVTNPSVMPGAPSAMTYNNMYISKNSGSFVTMTNASPYIYTYSFPVTDGVSNLKGLDAGIMALIGSPHFKGIGIAKNDSEAFGNVTVELFDPIKNALGGMA